MSCCNNKCDCCIERIKVTTVTVTATAVQLNEDTFNLINLPVGKVIEIDVDPDILPQSTLPVVLTDGTTTIPLWKESGNVMREDTFLPFCRRKARCFQFARVEARFLDDPSHLTVFRSQRRGY